MNRFKTRRYYLPKGIIEYYNVIINGKNFYDWAIDSDLKHSKKIRKVTTGQDEDCTIRCLLDYDYIKNYYRLIAVDLSRQKEFDANPKVTQQIEFVGQLKNKDNDYNTIDADDTIYVNFNRFRKNKRNSLKVLSKKCTSITKDSKLSRNES